MTDEHAGASTRTSKVINAAFIDPAALIAWLPPAEMTGVMHEFDARVGGGYRMSLFYPPDERVFRGKTSEREDMVVGEMTMTATFEEASDGTEVTLLFGKPAAGPASRGQRGGFAIEPGAAGPTLRVRVGL